MKKTYEKPKVQRIKLMLEEQCLGACKIACDGATGAGDLGYCGWHLGVPITPCNAAGS